jgi:hypothetical protein
VHPAMKPLGRAGCPQRPLSRFRLTRIQTACTRCPPQPPLHRVYVRSLRGSEGCRQKPPGHVRCPRSAAAVAHCCLPGRAAPAGCACMAPQAARQTRTPAVTSSSPAACASRAAPAGTAVTTRLPPPLLLRSARLAQARSRRAMAREGRRRARCRATATIRRAASQAS